MWHNSTISSMNQYVISPSVLLCVGRKFLSYILHIHWVVFHLISGESKDGNWILFLAIGQICLHFIMILKFYIEL